MYWWSSARDALSSYLTRQPLEATSGIETHLVDNIRQRVQRVSIVHVHRRYALGQPVPVLRQQCLTRLARPRTLSIMPLTLTLVRRGVGIDIHNRKQKRLRRWRIQPQRFGCGRARRASLIKCRRRSCTKHLKCSQLQTPVTQSTTNTPAPSCSLASN